MLDIDDMQPFTLPTVLIEHLMASIYLHVLSLVSLVAFWENKGVHMTKYILCILRCQLHAEYKLLAYCNKFEKEFDEFADAENVDNPGLYPIF
jgi:hypothetical protein